MNNFKIDDKPKQYNMDKWLTDNNFKSLGTLGDEYTYRYGDYTIFYKTHSLDKSNFNTSIIQWVDYVNTLGANLSYPEELPEFDFVEYMKEHGGRFHVPTHILKFNHLNTIYVRSNNTFELGNKDTLYKANKQNADALIVLDKHIQLVVEGLE